MQLQARWRWSPGAGRGIGRALCREFARRGAAGIVVADLDGALASATAAELGGLGLQCDVADAGGRRSDGADGARRITGAWTCSSRTPASARRRSTWTTRCRRPTTRWQRMWDVHVMSHARACRAVLPGMLARGSGCLVNVASAAGLLSQVGDTPYSVTKHAAVGLAESLAITYGDRGIQVSVVCPQYVATAITGLDEATAARHVAWRAHGGAGGASRSPTASRPAAS